MRNLSLLMLVFIVGHVHYGQALRVTTDFESGSARVVHIDSATQTIRIIPAGDPARGMPNWWYLRIDGIKTHEPFYLEVLSTDALIPAGSPGNLHKMSPNWTWPDQATYSVDGKNWKHSGAGRREENFMRYSIEPDSPTLWISWGPPFTPTDMNRYSQQLTQLHPFVTAFMLTKSKEGRQVTVIRINEGNKPNHQRPAIWVQARQHAWEVGGSWVAVGLAEWLAGNDPNAKWLRQFADIYIVPIMDVDHVSTGDGGKNCLPHDHNRDWVSTPYWPEVFASQQFIRQLAKERRMNIFLDLHNPAPGNKLQTMYVLHKTYMGKEAAIRTERFVALMQGEFGEIKEHRNGPKPATSNWGERVSEAWVLENANANTIGFCIETPWNAAQSTTEGYGATGRKIGTVIEKLLRHD